MQLLANRMLLHSSPLQQQTSDWYTLPSTVTVVSRPQSVDVPENEYVTNILFKGIDEAYWKSSIFGIRQYQFDSTVYGGIEVRVGQSEK